MKLLYTLLLLTITSVTSVAQDGLFQLSSSYFRSDPFAQEFSRFVEHVIKDPGYSDKQVNYLTDSTRFKFWGSYKNYNPFFFKPKKVELILEETIVQYDDSSSVQDTIFIYQLLAYNDATDEGIAEVKKEFGKIYRRYRKRFFEAKSVTDESDGKLLGENHNFFLATHALSPATVSWAITDDGKEVILFLTLRLRRFGNQTGVPAPFYYSERM